MSSALSVMIDGRYLTPRPSGIGRYTRELVVEMQRLRPEVTFRFVGPHPRDVADLAPERTVPFVAGAYGLRTTFELARRTGPCPADLFHSPFHVLPRGLRCRLVMTMHDTFQFDQVRWSNYPFPVSYAELAYFLLAIPESLRRADRVITVTRTTADDLIRRVPDVAGKITVIHEGVSPLFRRLPDREAVRRRCVELTGSEAPFLLVVGGISPNKNHEGMLRAFARAFPAGSPVRMAAVSRFGAPARLRKLAADLGVLDRYITLLSPSDGDLLTLLNGALCLSFFSLKEGFGLPVIEAQASGCPVLTSNRSCLPEVAGDAALFSDPEDIGDMAGAMRRLAGEPALREELIERGLARAALFTWERAASQTLEVYDLALGR